MPSSKKPRKPHRQKPCVKPLGMRDMVKMEMAGYQAIEALGQPHFCEQNVYDLLSNADMVKRIAKDGDEIREIAQAMIYACAEIQHRAQRTGKHGATGDEMRILREGFPLTAEYLRGVTNVQIDRAAREALREFDKTGVLRV